MDRSGEGDCVSDCGSMELMTSFHSVSRALIPPGPWRQARGGGGLLLTELTSQPASHWLWCFIILLERTASLPPLNFPNLTPLSTLLSRSRNICVLTKFN